MFFAFVLWFYFRLPNPLRILHALLMQFIFVCLCTVIMCCTVQINRDNYIEAKYSILFTCWKCFLSQCNCVCVKQKSNTFPCDYLAMAPM